MGITSQGFGQEGYVLDDSDVGPMAKPQKPEFNFTVGVPYYLPFSTPYRDSWEIFRDDPVTIRQLISMLRQDGQARALYRLITMPILACLKDAQIVPPDKYEDADQQQVSDQGPAGATQDTGSTPVAPQSAILGEADSDPEVRFVHNLFFLPKSAGGMTHTFQQFIRRCLLATVFGFAGFEMVYWVPKTGPNKGKITLRKIDWRPVETLTFLLDGQGEFNGFRQRTFFQGRTIDVKIPRERAFYYTCGEEERPFYGISLFESAFYHYDKKTKLYYIVHLAAQRAAVGTRVGTMPPNPDATDKNNFVAAMKDLGMAQYIILPSSDWTVQVVTESTGQFDFLGLINHHNSMMSKSILAQWFDGQAVGRGANDSTLVDFGNQDTETFMDLEDAIMDDLETVISQQIIPRFIDWNFGSGRYPRFKFGTLTSEQKAAVQDTFDKLAAVPPGQISPQFMHSLEERMADTLGLNVDYEVLKRQWAQDDVMQRQISRQQMAMQLQNPFAGAGQSAGQPQPPPPGPPGPPGPAGPPGQQGGGGAFSAEADQQLIGLVREVLADIVEAK